jgi:Transglycosylase SLT domain
MTIPGGAGTSRLALALAAVIALLLLTGCDSSQSSSPGGPPSCSDAGALQGDLAAAPDELKQAADFIAGIVLDTKNVQSSTINCALLLALAKQTADFGRQQRGHATSGCGVPDAVVKEVDPAKLAANGKTMTELGIKNDQRTVCDWVDPLGGFGFLHYPKDAWESAAAKAKKDLGDAFDGGHPDPYNPDDAMAVAAIALFDAVSGGQDRKAAVAAFLGGGQAGDSGATAVLDLVARSRFEDQAGPPGGAGAPGDVKKIIMDAFAPLGATAQGWGMKIAACESSYNPKAYNPTPVSNGEHAEGLFQFIPSTFAGTPQGRAGMSIWDPVANAQAAAWMYGQGRQGEWECNQKV